MVKLINYSLITALPVPPIRNPLFGRSLRANETAISTLWIGNDYQSVKTHYHATTLLFCLSEHTAGWRRQYRAGSE